MAEIQTAPVTSPVLDPAAAPQTMTEAYDTETCLSYLFPFVGRRYVVKPGLTGEYWDSERRTRKPCRSLFEPTGDDIIDPIINLVITAGIAWFLWSQFQSRK